MRKFLMLALAGIFVHVAAAQNNSNKNKDSLGAEIKLEEITISATRFAENNKFLAQQVQSIDAKKIQALNQPTSAELLTHTGNVLVQKSQLGGGSPLMRGFEANKVLIVVDGVRMNNAIFRGGHLQNILSMDNAVLEKTELLFGPASVMYGSDALGGVISFYTKKPTLANPGSKKAISAAAFTRFSSAYNELTAHADINIGGTKLASFTGLTVSSFGDLRQGANYYSRFPNWGKRSFYVTQVNGTDSMIANPDPQKQKFTGYKQYDLIQKFLFKAGKFEHVFNFQYSTSSDIPRYDRLTETNSNGTARSAQWYYGPQKRLMAAWQMSLPATAVFDKAQLTTAYQAIEESRHNRNYRSSNLNHRTEKVKVATLNADFFKRAGKQEFNYGAEITYNKINSSANRENISTGALSALDTRYPDGGSNTQSYAVYAALTHKFSEKLNLNTGLRFTQNKLFSKFNDTIFFPFPFREVEQRSGAVSGNLGIVYRTGADWKFSAMFSSGFRTPNVDDMSKVFESNNGTLIIPNPNLGAEKTKNAELSISKKINGKILLSGTGWYTKYTDVLTSSFSTYNGADSVLYNGSMSRVTTLVNKNKAYIWGLSASLHAQLGKHFSLFSTINYTKGRIREEPNDYPLDHIAPLFGKTGLTLKYGKWNAEIFTLYNGTKDSLNYNLRGEDNQLYSADPIRGYTPAWFTLNTRISYECNRFLTVQLAAENLFDKYYRVYASGLSAPGRNISATLRGRF
ncbi:MAG: TonB-dependent receptor [Ferruginibacter sp.]